MYKRQNYYWLTGEYVNLEPDQEDTDHWALDHDYVAITPVQVDMTAYALLAEMKNWDLKL